MMKSIYLSPHKRHRLIAKLQRIVADPRLPSKLRKDAERHLRNQMAIQRWEANATRH